MSVAWVAVGTTVVGGLHAASEQRRAGREARRQGEENAEEIYQTALRNNELLLGAAHFNAGMTLEVANANAAAIERNALRNAELMTMEYEEELRRHIRLEKQLAGSIRASAGASGVQVNQGTPLLYLHNELDEAEREREFIRDRGKLTVFNYLTTEQEKADLMRLEGALNAEAIVFNAQTEAEIYLNEQVGVANATRRQGQDAYRSLRDQSYLTLANTAIGAFSQGTKYGIFNSSPSPRKPVGNAAVNTNNGFIGNSSNIA